MDLQLQNKVVIVTGGAKGIGEAITRGFAAEGSKVVVANRSAEAGIALIEELTNAGVAVHYVQAELREEAACKRVIDETLAHFGGIDVLVHNAGGNDAVGLERPPTDFMRSIENNLLHVYTLTHLARAHLIKSRGCIVNVGSKVVETGQGNTSGYAAAKGAMNALTREWAVDLSAHGIRVNTVVPAEVWTPMYERWLNSLDRSAEVKQSIEKLIPLGHRFTTSEEIAAMVVFLASARSSHTTGQIIYVDGGYTHFDRAFTA
ncbi:MAG: L-fucose dehydrogenase [Candidatus Omnitrophota bacterium]|jgi:L-fucose dehydrogenase